MSSGSREVDSNSQRLIYVIVIFTVLLAVNTVFAINGKSLFGSGKPASSKPAVTLDAANN